MSDLTERIYHLMEAMHQLQLENDNIRELLRKLQVGTPSPLHPTTSMEPKISLPNKFDGTRKHFRGFINKIKLIIQLQSHRYVDDFRQVGLIGTLLSGAAQAWFALLVETSSPLLQDFPTILAEFDATFGDTDRR